MATASVKYFHRTTELENVNGMRIEEFARRFPGVKGIRFDSFQMWVGYPKGFNGTSAEYLAAALPVERRVSYKTRPSLHECNARCLNGRHDGTCECQCGGRNHGLGSILAAAGV